MEKHDFEKLIEEARTSDLLEYFRSSGYSIDKKGNQYYIKEFTGLCINPETNSWYNHYTGVGRTNNSLDCLTLVLGESFNQAVFELTGQDVTQKRATDFPIHHSPEFTSPPKKEQTETKIKELVMPEHSQNMRQLFAYLCKTRKIPPKIVEELVHSDLLYQSQNTVKTKINEIEQTFKNANAVFIHKDENNNIIGGEIQGLNSFKRYKGLVSGTKNSVFKFMPYPTKDKKPKTAFLFESAIDLMSFYTFCNKNKLEGVMLISMSGLKPSIPKQLEEQGVKIYSCVDNDDAGRKFEKENGFERPDGVRKNLDEKEIKDWNELLVAMTNHSNTLLKENNTDVNETQNNDEKISVRIRK